MQSVKGTDTEMEGVEMIIKPRWKNGGSGEEKKGKRKSLTCGGYEPSHVDA